MSLIEGYRKDVRTITVTDQTFLAILRSLGPDWPNLGALGAPLGGRVRRSIVMN
jgi:hypothetical protein